MTWRVETLNETVDRELDALSADMRARLSRTGRLIATVGLERVGAPHVRHLAGPLWEIRLSGRDGIARALYVVAPGRRVVVVRAFVKKTRRTPRREIRLALSRAREALQ
ncbi:MAG: type II toxin-antitoxin system RelE/ParE family toxin [Boseongicola sp.]|nr:type II toxin-antitoxin system RelE/ParE family toxin [Boseongicola sp.]